jgi:hypothetical protein
VKPKHTNNRGGVLVAWQEFTEKDRKNVRALCRDPEGGEMLPEVERCQQPPPGHRQRIAAHMVRVRRALRVPKGDPEVGPPQACWGACGRALPCGSRPRKHGWYSRPIMLAASATSVIEVYCPKCFHEHGYIDLEDGTMPKTGREAVNDATETACYTRLTDKHLVGECDECGCVLLSDRHAAEVETDPHGLPPLAAGTITLAASARTLRFCHECIGTRVMRVPNTVARPDNTDDDDGGEA